MNDYWNDCFDPAMGMSPDTFKNTFCKVCRNPECSRSSTQRMAWTQRMKTQMERLFENPKFADPNDPQYQDIRKVDFPSAVQEAMRLEITDRRGDWSVPTKAEIANLASEMVAKTGAPQAPPSPVVLQSFDIEGDQGVIYEVACVEHGTTVRWTCTCKAFEFGGGKPCKHITYAQSLPPEDAPEPEAEAPARFQGAPKQATVPSGPQAPFFPAKSNIPVPPGGIMLDGTKPIPPRDRVDPRAKPEVDDPWAPAPPKPTVIPVGGKVVLGGGKK